MKDGRSGRASEIIWHSYYCLFPFMIPEPQNHYKPLYSQAQRLCTINWSCQTSRVSVLDTVLFLRIYPNPYCFLRDSKSTISFEVSLTSLSSFFPSLHHLRRLPAREEGKYHPHLCQVRTLRLKREIAMVLQLTDNRAKIYFHCYMVTSS